MEKCSYCGNDRDGVTGWHGCSQSLDSKARIETLIDSMTRIAKGVPNTGPMTSEAMRQVADRRKDIANTIQLNGGHVTPGYENYDGR